MIFPILKRIWYSSGSVHLSVRERAEIHRHTVYVLKITILIEVIRLPRAYTVGFANFPRIDRVVKIKSGDFFAG